jgi:hypothetical protein
MKTCKNCKETKELTMFSRDRDNKDGYKTLCKTCSHKRSLDNYHIRAEAKRANQQSWLDMARESHNRLLMR